jgi:hypothetical protein
MDLRSARVMPHFSPMNRAAATLEVCANLGWETVAA